MQAIRGHYKEGIFTPDKKVPPYDGRAIVIFTDEDMIEKPPRPPRKRMTEEEAKAFVEKYRGCLKGIDDPKAERLAYLDEKYGITD